MPTPSAAPENRMPRVLTNRSIALGTNAMTTVPAVGSNTARVTADFSQPLIRSP